MLKIAEHWREQFRCCRMQDVFDAVSDKVVSERLLWHAIHPLPIGHELIARQWLGEVSDRWLQVK